MLLFNLHVTPSQCKLFKMKDKVCYFCQYKTTKSTNFEAHLRTHTKEKPFLCMEQSCFLSFGHQSPFDTHCRTVHKIVKSNKHHRSTPNCYFCRQDFVDNYSLDRHVMCHTRERPYKCLYKNCKNFSCSSQARNKHALLCNYNPYLKNNIQKVQSLNRKVLNEGQFQCYFCLKNFTSKNILFTHIKNHTGGLKVFCSGCKIRFNSRDIHKHRYSCIKNRRLFTCPFCNCSKGGLPELNFHIQNVHTKDSVKTKCYFCNASFPEYTMRNHLVLHTKEKSYKCRYCDFSFVLHTSLKSHIAAKHRDTQEGWKSRKKLRRKCYFCKKYFPSFTCLRNHMVQHTLKFRKR